jgi:hypothetical protein
MLVVSLCAFGVGAEEANSIEVRPTVRSVAIEENGAWTTSISGDAPREACTDFILTQGDVRQFFKVARDATEREYGHDLEMSRCYVSGRVVLQDGRRAHWEIDRTRRGALWFPDGSILYFYCGKCSNAKYYEDCDIDCIHAH